MVREIKFRAWVKENNSEQNYAGMYQVHSLSLDGVVVIRSSMFAPSLFPINDVVIMQYTGLKDKNDKEIYEGDVIKFFDRGNMFDNDLLPCTAQVVMEYARWSIKPIDVKGLRNFQFNGIGGYEKCEVIGNIYENPEVLK